MPGPATPPSTSTTSVASALGEAPSELDGSSLLRTPTGAGDAAGAAAPGARSIQPAAPASSRAPPIPASTNRSVSGTSRLAVGRQGSGGPASEVRRPGTRRRTPEADQEDRGAALTGRLPTPSPAQSHCPRLPATSVARRHHIHEPARDLDHASRG